MNKETTASVPLDYYSAKKKNGIVSFTEKKWMHREITMLN